MNATHGHYTRKQTSTSHADSSTTSRACTSQGDPPPAKKSKTKTKNTKDTPSLPDNEEVQELSKDMATDPVDWGGMEHLDTNTGHSLNITLPAMSDNNSSHRKRQVATETYPMAPPDELDEYGFQRQDVDGITGQSIRIDQNSISHSINQALNDRFAGSRDCLGNILVSGHAVDEKIKLQIWSHQYINLTILDKAYDQGGSASNMSGPQAPFTSKQNPKQVATFAEWSRLFHIYCSIYCVKYPQEAVQLFSYVNQIQALHNRRPISYLWRAYDESFRRVRSNATTLPWHIRYQQILSEAEDDLNLEKLRSSFRRPPPSSTVTSTSATPKINKQNFCYDYNNRGQTCSRQNCRFMHKCAKCSLSHPAYMCRKDPPMQKPPTDSKQKK